MSDLKTIAQPYAKAAFDFALANKSLDQWAYMLMAAADVAHQPVILQEIKEIDFKGAKNAEAFTLMFLDICEGLLDEHGQNFVRVMAENSRLSVLPDVLNLFMEMKADFERTIEATVLSVEPLTEEQKVNLVKALEKRLSRSVELDCQIDESLVGGMLIKAGELVIDGTLKSSINRLASSLQA
jgi:F-type H+-transporting ATPase subunit delta